MLWCGHDEFFWIILLYTHSSDPCIEIVLLSSAGNNFSIFQHFKLSLSLSRKCKNAGGEGMQISWPTEQLCCQTTYARCWLTLMQNAKWLNCLNLWHSSLSGLCLQTGLKLFSSCGRSLQSFQVKGLFMQQIRRQFLGWRTLHSLNKWNVEQRDWCVYRTGIFLRTLLTALDIRCTSCHHSWVKVVKQYLLIWEPKAIDQSLFVIWETNIPIWLWMTNDDFLFSYSIFSCE